MTKQKKKSVPRNILNQLDKLNKPKLPKFKRRKKTHDEMMDDFAAEAMMESKHGDWGNRS